MEEADETEQWLLVLLESDIGRGAELDTLYDESRQLRAILKASYDTAKVNYARQILKS